MVVTGWGGGALAHPLIAATVTSNATDVAKNPIVIQLQVVFMTHSISPWPEMGIADRRRYFVASGYGVCIL